MLGNRSSVAGYGIYGLSFILNWIIVAYCAILPFKPAYPLGPHSLRSCVPYGGWRGGYAPFDPP
jgi:hypothetical protein